MPGKKTKIPSPGCATRKISSYTNMSSPRMMLGDTSFRRRLGAGAAFAAAWGSESSDSDSDSESSNSPLTFTFSSSQPSASYPPVPKARSASLMAR
eukprot:Skav202274  [mRNA]  locus=scaffold3044:34507:39985:+ [translate_table: standard]